MRISFWLFFFRLYVKVMFAELGYVKLSILFVLDTKIVWVTCLGTTFVVLMARNARLL